MKPSSRLVSGNDESYKKLEKILAKHKSQQNSLIYPTGYMANLGSISAIASKGDLILSDELNHASIIESCKLSGAKISIYKHNDMDDLADKIKKQGKNKFVITDGVFSMDGDTADVSEIQKKQMTTTGNQGSGSFAGIRNSMSVVKAFNVAKKIDYYCGFEGLGSFGGYVASQNNVIDLCINKSKSFIYTSALPSFLVQHSIKRIESDRETQKKKLENNVEELARGLRSIGYEIKSNTQIIPIILGNEKLAMDFGKFLSANGIFAQPIRYPTVPKNQARLRISVTAWLTNTDIEKSLKIFEKAYRKFL